MILFSIMRGDTYRDTSTMWQHEYWQVSYSVPKVLKSILQCQQDVWDKLSANPIL